MKARLPQGYGSSGMNPNNMMKQIQKMQADMQTAQEELEKKEDTSVVGGGAVEITMTGKKQVTSVKISPDVVDPDDVEMLEDLMLSAVNEAVRQADEYANAEMAKATGGMGGGMF